MADHKNNSEKMAAVLRYWLEHSGGHHQETRKWSALARELGFDEVAGQFERIDADAGKHEAKLRELLGRMEEQGSSGHGRTTHEHRHGHGNGHEGSGHVHEHGHGNVHAHGHEGSAHEGHGARPHLHLNPIGTIRTPYPEGTPWEEMQEEKGDCTLELHASLAPGLRMLDRFRYIIVLFVFHLRHDQVSLDAHPPHAEDLEVGVFASRSPARPNHIGMKVTPVRSIADNRIITGRIDAYDGTPLLDIKPYIEMSDSVPGAGNGWLDTLRASGCEWLDTERPSGGE
jgi:tRNA-Thr(GGU) m(6)t(6)A37 methyltransferase TsaA